MLGLDGPLYVVWSGFLCVVVCVEQIWVLVPLRSGLQAIWRVPAGRSPLAVAVVVGTDVPLDVVWTSVRLGSVLPG